MNLVKMANKAALLFIVSLLTFSFTASAGSSFWDHYWQPNYYQKGSDNHDKAMTFIADRPFDSVDGTFFVDGMFGGDGMDFFKNTMGFSDKEIEESRKKALAFYKKRFGLDENDPKVYFTGFQIEPAAGYRVVMMTGKRRNPRKGYPIVDGGWAFAVVDPDGYDLGGEFEGTHVPAGTMFAFGNYVIKRGKGRKDMVISYKSRGPMQPVGTGGVINCEVSHPKFGDGVGWGYFELHNLSNGQVSAQVRNVLTFPGFGYEEELIEY